MSAVTPDGTGHDDVRDAVAVILDRLVDRQRLRVAGHDEGSWRTNVRSQWRELGYHLPFTTWGDTSAALEHVATVSFLAGHSVAPFATASEFAADLLYAADGRAAPSAGAVLAEPRLAGRGRVLGPRVVGTVKGTETRITGRAPLVLAPADTGTVLILVDLDDSGAVAPLPITACEVRPLDTIDVSIEAALLEFDVVVPTASLLPCDADLERRVLAVQAFAQLNELVGVGRQAFAETLGYIEARFAFGRSVASFQAIKHRCADLEKTLLECEGCVTSFGRQLREGDGLTWEQLFAVEHVKRSIPDLVQECIQLHGGIGMTWECDQHLFLRRATLLAATGVTADDAYDLWCAAPASSGGAA